MKVRGNDIDLGHIVGGGRVGMTAEQRAYHLWTVGGTGVGKSKLFEHIIRQDVANWKNSECGLLLLDWHGSIYDNLIEWLAEFDNLNRPIISIDLRRDDWVTAYNLLRQRKDVKPSVIVRSFVDAIAYAWNQPTTEDTPRFARLAGFTLRTLLANGCTIAEAADLLTKDDVRKAMVAMVTEGDIRDEWEKSFRYPKEFVEKIESTLNRFNRISESELFKAMLGQVDISLDFGQALEKGQIILVSLATAGGKVSDDDAATFARLLLSDLWQAAKARDIRDGAKPFYVYLDEFQELVSPPIGKTLDQARKFGLHLAMANQYPNQLLNAAGYGKALFDSAIANASTKIVFRTEHPENLETLARSLFMGTFDPDLVKHEIWSTKVVDYREEIREDVTESEGEVEGGADGTTETVSESARIRDGEEELDAWNRSIARSEAAIGPERGLTALPVSTFKSPYSAKNFPAANTGRSTNSFLWRCSGCLLRRIDISASVAWANRHRFSHELPRFVAAGHSPPALRDS